MMSQMTSQMTIKMKEFSSKKKQSGDTDCKQSVVSKDVHNQKAIFLPMLNKSPRLSKPSKIDFEDSNLEKTENNKIKILPMRSKLCVLRFQEGIENPFMSPHTNKISKASNANNKLIHSVDGSSLMDVLNQQTSDMLFSFDANASAGKFSQSNSIDAHHYNRFYSHFERQKDKQAVFKKNVRFSNDGSLRREAFQPSSFYLNDKKPILKNGQNNGKGAS